jgi:RNA-directed DNA polymerase
MVANQPIEDWSTIPWPKLERIVYRLQKRIYQASLRGNIPAVHSLQRLLQKSQAARCLAVRRVTQDNQGKRTAGIDGVKSVPPTERLPMVSRLRQPTTIKAQATRRVWIPQPGKTEKRPLGIPVMLDRAHQALVKLALEPEGEARFEPNSYGFRPGRGGHDAIGALTMATSRKEKYVLDADIQGCFDHIAHASLLAALATYPTLRRTVKSWLKAGVLSDTHWQPTERGTPQGGVVSPLLANIALHGMEDSVHAAFRRADRPMVVRYADDFVILHPTHAGIERARQVVETWLDTRGLTLKASKTRIVHTRQPIDGHVGFDFLGFSIRQHRVGRTKGGKDSWGRPLSFKLFIRPSKDAIKRHLDDLHQIVRDHRAAPQGELITALNPVIRGWALYYRTVAATQTFRACDHHLFTMLRRWARYRHPHKSNAWLKRRYWTTKGRNTWRFAASDGRVLAQHTATTIRLHVKVKGAASPFDGNLVYWSQRLRAHPLTTTRIGILLRRQAGQCAHCGRFFTDQDRLEVDHIVPRLRGGRSDLANLRVIHRHCHDQRGLHDTNHVSEEPDEVESLTSGFADEPSR